MSRTDKDAPRWVRVKNHHTDAHADTVVYHSSRCVESPGLAGWRRRRVHPDVAAANGWRLDPRWVEYNTPTRVYVLVPQTLLPCDLDTALGQCTRRLPRHAYDPGVQHRWGMNKADRAAYWTGPDRAQVRDTLRKAVQEYRGTGDVDVDPPTFHHRHDGRWWD